VCYGQIIISSGGDQPTIIIDYNAPKKYEIAGITSSGTANFDQRLLYFSVGSIIEIPGEEITKSIKRLWNTGMYEDISISITKIIDNKAFIDIYLVERSRLVVFSFFGTTKGEETEIREKIKISQGNIVNDNLKITCANTIKKYYTEKGFYNCSVEVIENKDTKVVNGVNLQFVVNKGKKVRINSIEIIGNNHVSKAPLVKVMKGTREKSRFTPFFLADTVLLYMFKNPEYYASKDLLEHLNDYFSDRVKFRIFKPSKFNVNNYEDDKVALVEKYNEFGYRDAFIVHDTVMIDKNAIRIQIKVEEGKKYYFRNISFVGNTKYRSELLNQLLNIKKGDEYNLSRLNQNLTMNATGTDISSLYMNDGHLFFYANPVEILIENDSIDIEVRIREGKQAKYNKIEITGNTKTNDNVIMRELTTIPGQLFNRADIIRTQQVLLALGYFNQEKMDVIPKPNETDGTVDIEFVVEEASSDQFELSIGYGAQSLILSAGISFNNFSFKRLFKKDAWSPIPSGDGQRLAFRASTNAIWYQYYVVSFSEPWLGGKKPNALTVTVNYQKQSSGYRKTDSRHGSFEIIGTSLSFGKKLKWPDDYFQVSHTLQYQYYRVKNYPQAFIFSDGYSNNISYTFMLGRSSISAPIYPREGSELFFSVQLTPPYSLLSKKKYSILTDAQEKYKWLEFHKWKFNISWFTKVVENFVLNVRLKSGFIGFYNEKLGYPPFERFYLGGDGLATWTLDGREVIGMRGYVNEELTVLTNGQKVGGIIYNKLTAEIRYPISLNPNATIYLLAFVEAGNTWLDKRSYSPFNLHKSAGVGIRINLPMFGLLGFDWGYGFDPPKGSTMPSGSHFHISINSSID